MLRLLGELEAELHALIAVAEELGDASQGGVGLAQDTTYGVHGGEQLVCVVEQAEVGAVHTYGASLVQQSE